MSRPSQAAFVAATTLLICLGAAIPAAAVPGPDTVAPQAGLPGPHTRVLDYAVHEAGDVRCPVTNWGQIGSRPGSNGLIAAEPSFEWPAGSGVYYLWTAGLWLGAIRNGEPRVTTSEFAVEVRPGPGASDIVYTTHENAPGGARHPSPLADDDQDGLVDEDPLNGRDDDFDGAIDEDFAAISDEMLACEFNDYDPAIVGANPQHVPLHVDVAQSSFAWSDPRIDALIAVRYRILNTGLVPLDEVFVGLFADCDIGPHAAEQISEDDRAGFWDGEVTADIGGPMQSVRVPVAYTFDTNGDAGQSPGYLGMVFLGARDDTGAPISGAGIANVRVFSGSAGYAFGGDPTNDEQRYEVLNGTSPQSLPPPDPVTGFYPAFVTGRDDDYRMTFSAGSIPVLEPGHAVELAFALVVGEGLEGLKLNAARAKLLYDNDWRTAGPVAVTLQDFAGLAGAGGVELGWRLGGDPSELRSVRVERGLALGGPWTEIAALSPAAEMTYVDADARSVRGGGGDGEALWYRLVLERTDGTHLAQPALRIDTALRARFAIESARERSDGLIEVRFELADAHAIDLAVFDVRGRRVAELARGASGAGSHVHVWDGRDAGGVQLARGVYFLRLEGAGQIATARLLRTR